MGMWTAMDQTCLCFSLHTLPGQKGHHTEDEGPQFYVYLISHTFRINRSLVTHATCFTSVLAVKRLQWYELGRKQGHNLK